MSQLVFMNEFKSKAYQAAISYVKEKLHLLTEERKAIHEGILEETKSSAGDKFETSREMMTQDLLTVEGQLKQCNFDLEELLRLQTIKETPITVQEGSLLKLGTDWFLLTVSLGQLNVANEKVFFLSKNSPLGQTLVGIKKNDQVAFRGKSQSVTEIH